MGASAYIGRVGGLAVALGIGVAVATGQGVAWAGPEPDSTATEPPPAAEKDGAQNPDTTLDSPAADPPAADPPAASPTPEKKREVQPPSLTALASRANSVLSSLTRAAERGIAVTSGGALTSKRVNPQKDADAVETEEPQPVKQADAVPAKKSSDGPTNKPVERVVRNLKETAFGVEPRSVEPRSVEPRSVEPRKVDIRKATAAAAKPAEAVVHSAAADVQNAFQTLSATVSDPVAAPKLMAASEAPVAQPTLPRLLTNLVSVFGLGALASNNPGAPIGTPIVMALLALGTRRESESITALGKTAAVGNSTVAALTLTDVPNAAVAAAPSDPSTSYVVTPVAVSGNTSIITKLTGPGGLNDTQRRFGVGGTDLGIMWDNGIKDNPNTTVAEQHQVLVLFGDSFSTSSPVRTGVWRNNMLFRSTDNMLSNGMYVQDGSVPVDGTTADDFSGAPLVYNEELKQNIFKQVIANERYAVGNDVTIIPTSAISVPYNNAYGSRQYASFMDVRSWDTPGRWATNYSGIAFSDDNGVTWHVAPESVRASASGYSTKAFVSGNQNFQQMAFVKPPEGSADAAAGYVYAYGTPSGRGGTVYLSRVQSGPDTRPDQVRVLGRNEVGRQQAVRGEAGPAGDDDELLLRSDQEHDIPVRGRNVGAVQRIREAVRHALPGQQQQHRDAEGRSARGAVVCPDCSGHVVGDAGAVCADDSSVVVDDERAGVGPAVPVLECVDMG